MARSIFAGLRRKADLGPVARGRFGPDADDIRAPIEIAGIATALVPEEMEFWAPSGVQVAPMPDCRLRLMNGVAYRPDHGSVSIDALIAFLKSEIAEGEIKRPGAH